MFNRHTSDSHVDDLQDLREETRVIEFERDSTMVNSRSYSCFTILKRSEHGATFIIWPRKEQREIGSLPLFTRPFHPSFCSIFFLLFQGLAKSIVASKTDVNNGTPLPLDPCRDVDTRFARLGG